MRKTIKVTSVINSVLPTPGQLLGEGTGLVDLAVRFLVLEHPDEGVILVDGGYGPEIRAARGVKARLYRMAMHMPREIVTPQMALAHLGLAPADIRHVILTHLHADHVCNLGIAGPGTQLHVSRDVAEMLRDYRLRGARPGLRSGDFPELVPEVLASNISRVEEAPRIMVRDGKSRALDGYDILGDGSVLATPLPGHARGHIGLALPRVAGSNHPFVYAADAAWTYEGLMKTETPAEWIASADRAAAAQSRTTVMQHFESQRTVMLCHDDRRQAVDLDLLAATPAEAA